jgi:hypothetical protein
MGNEISDAVDIDLSSVVKANDVSLPTDSHTFVNREHHPAIGHTVAIDRFREMMKATGGRFAEMTVEEESEIVDYLATFAQPLWQHPKGATE